MKLLLISDIDDPHWKYGSGTANVLISCGDVHDGVIIEAAESYGCSRIFAVKGNHDTGKPFTEGIMDLHLRIYKYREFRLGGFNGCWKYKAAGHYLYEQEEVEDLLQSFPQVDIFVSHNSPRGIHDKDDEVHYGFRALNHYIVRSDPDILFHGHQHCNRESRLNGTRIIGVYGYKVIDV